MLGCKEQFKLAWEDAMGCRLQDASVETLYRGLLAVVNDEAQKRKTTLSGRRVYYFSAEFLVGKLLSNQLYNLGLYAYANELLEEVDVTLSLIEECETEPSLGNGGLGRLAACFLDSIATLGYPGAGIGLNYHMGLFRQSIKDGSQKEKPDCWLGEDSLLLPVGEGFPVSMGGKTYHSTMYELLVTGYENRTNPLYLFDLPTVDESIVKRGISFDPTEIEKCLTLFLYPDDSTEEGRKLRIYQQYFMVSNGAQLILRDLEAAGLPIEKLDEYVAIQINDTHPSLVIPELIRLLCARGMAEEEAVRVVTNCCAYTNHTILAEALETWPLTYLQEIVPDLVPIIKRLDQRVKEKYQDPAVAIIDAKKMVHMAHLDIHYGHSVNGVAELHTEILKKSELAPFYAIYPEKFNNKTNGITFRRWLMLCNPELTAFLTQTLGDGFYRDATKLEELLPYLEDDTVLRTLREIKDEKKRQFASYLEKTQGICVDPTSIFDVQAKRLHEYKRQQLNLLWVIKCMFEIRRGLCPKHKVTVFFGAKAAPAYRIAKDIICAILAVEKVIAQDPLVSKYLEVVMLENYNVTYAEKLIPACDISEQISLASKEASGTGNMKFMLNGAVTVGTKDGANIEILERVGSENFYAFGMEAGEVMAHYEAEDYVPKAYYVADPVLAQAVDFLISEEMLEAGKKTSLRRLHRELLKKDWFMTFPDFASYCTTRERAYADYEDRNAFTKKAGVNIAMAGFFSSDRTIYEYNRDIWHLKPESPKE